MSRHYLENSTFDARTDMTEPDATPSPDANGNAADGTAANGTAANGTDAPAALPAESAGDALAASAPETPAASADQLARLEQARTSLLRVHRALLEVERARYEKVRGRIANNSAFLQLVISDPWFDWLRPMAQLVLLIDERTSDKKSILGSVEAKALFDRARSLLRADIEGDAFQRLYYQAVQASPELAVVARQVAISLE
ncbi:MAG: hypothetical protein V4617_21655 [Gemmatimonadota bacterium]